MKKRLEEKKDIKIVYATNPLFLEGEDKEFFKDLLEKSEVQKYSCIEVDSFKLKSIFETKGIFDDLTLIHLKNCEKLKKDSSKKLLELLKKKPEDTYVFIEYVGDLSLKNKSLDENWKEICNIFKPKNCNPVSVKSYVLRRAQKEGVEVEENALYALEDWALKDLNLLPQAMDILLISAMEKKRIEEKDVGDLLGSGGSSTIFELFDKFLLKDSKGVVFTIGKIELDTSISALPFVSFFYRQFQYMGIIKSFLKQGKELKDITPSMVDNRLYNFQFEKLKQALHLWSDDEVLNVLSTLCFLDKSLKGDKLPEWFCVEKFLLKHIQKEIDFEY